jgi:hypothetical protein
MGEMSRGWLPFYTRCAQQYGDIVRFRIAHVPIYLLVHPRDIEYVLVKNSANFTKSADYNALTRLVGNGLLTSRVVFGADREALSNQPSIEKAFCITRR